MPASVKGKTGIPRTLAHARDDEIAEQRTPFLYICINRLGSFSECVSWEMIVVQTRSVLKVEKMIVLPGSIWGIVDDRTPDATLGVGSSL